jgi:hypothetical protein
LAQIKFDINKAFKEVFGVYNQTPLFATARQGQGQGIGLENYPDAELLEGGEQSFSQLTYQADFVENMHGAVLVDRFQVQASAFGTYNLSPYTIMELTRAKNIVKTPMLGRNGTVKEFISLDDWQVTFKGFLINDQDDSMPHAEVARLLEVFGVNEQLLLVSEAVRQYFQRTTPLAQGEALEFIVIEEVRLPALEGFSNVQPFEIVAVSDNPVEIELLTNA